MSKNLGGRPKVSEEIKAERKNISIPKNLLKEWDEVIKDYNWTRSAMIQDFLKEVLPTLRKKKSPRELIKAGLEKSKEFQSQMEELKNAM